MSASIASALPRASAAATTANSGSQLHGALRILIVEDDALIGMLLGDMLELMGHEVCAIEATETEAVSAAARYEPNMMIIDAHLRDGNGMAAVDRIIANGYIAHVFVTGDQHSISNFRPGAVVISKPFTEATLAGAISRARVNT